jgi:hypothetical protein
MSNGYLRSLVVVGATAMIRYAVRRARSAPDGSTAQTRQRMEKFFSLGRVIMA